MLPNLELKIRPKQLLDCLPLDISVHGQINELDLWQPSQFWREIFWREKIWREKLARKVLAGFFGSACTTVPPLDPLLT